MTYLKLKFSINESRFPNVHVSYDSVQRYFFWYLALSKRLKFKRRMRKELA